MTEGSAASAERTPDNILLTGYGEMLTVFQTPLSNHFGIAKARYCMHF